jgi:hypothetical protein
MRWLVGPALACLCACGPVLLPPDFGGEPLWEELDGANARDLGEPTGEVPLDERERSGRITLTDVTASAGLTGVTSGGNTHGVGIAFVDVDGDDWADILVVNGRSNVSGSVHASRLLRNRRDGTFEDITNAAGVAAILDGIDGYSIAAGDLDGDRYIDLYVGAQPTDVLLRNRGDGTFEDATADANAGGPPSDPSLVINGKSKVVGIGDIDDDGHLDLVSASSTLTPPTPGAYVLRNRGDGTFEDITEQSGVKIDPVGNPCALMWSDYDTDGDRDLHIWNDRGGHVLLRNDGGTLTDVTAASALDDVTVTHPMGIDAADIDHDGDLDYYVSNIGNNPLLRNNGDGTFVDITELSGTGGQYGWGLGFVDFDSDSRADIFVAQEDDRPELVFHNRGGTPPAFARIDIAHPPVRDPNAAHNVAVGFADYDHDGRVDVVTARTDGSNIVLYRNETELGTAGWLHVAIETADGDLETTDGIGARVAVGTGDLVQFLDITGGSSRASQTEHTARFGLGQFRGADWVGVLWPTGRQALVLNVGADQRLTISE